MTDQQDRLVDDQLRDMYGRIAQTPTPPSIDAITVAGLSHTRPRRLWSVIGASGLALGAVALAAVTIGSHGHGPRQTSVGLSPTPTAVNTTPTGTAVSTATAEPTASPTPGATALPTVRPTAKPTPTATPAPSSTPPVAPAFPGAVPATFRLTVVRNTVPSDVLLVGDSSGSLYQLCGDYPMTSKPGCVKGQTYTVTVPDTRGRAYSFIHGDRQGPGPNDGQVWNMAPFAAATITQGVSNGTY